MSPAAFILIPASFAGALLIGGCAADVNVAGGPAITDQAAPDRARVRVIEGARESAPDDPAGRRIVYEDLKTVVWLRGGNPERVRLAAIRELAEFEAELEETRKMFRLALPTEPSADAVVLMTEIAAEHGWSDLAPALVRRWVRDTGRDVSPADRVEARAMKTLFPGQPPAQVVLDVFTGRIAGVALEDADRLAAWELLNELDPTGDTARGVARAAPNGDPLVQVLRRGEAELGVIPRTGEELAWLQRLAGAEQAAFWQAARVSVGRLTPEQRLGLELRHLPAIVHASRHQASLLDADREQLGRMIEASLAERRRLVRRAMGETLRDWRRRMVWGDALTVALAAEAVTDPGVRAALFGIADQDMGDISTEHGGTLGFTRSGAPIVEHFPPRASERFGDTRFVASRTMIESSDEALLHFHLHAQRHDNKEYAGPSGEDLENAARLGRSSLVLTFTSADEMNADYYQGDGVVIDLGTIRRPRG